MDVCVCVVSLEKYFLLYYNVHVSGKKKTNCVAYNKWQKYLITVDKWTFKEAIFVIS